MVDPLSLPTPAEAGTIGSMFRHAVRRFAARPALVLPGESWSYGDLGRIAAGAAARLDAAAVGARSRVAIVGNNHPAYVAAYLGSQVLGRSTVEIGRGESLETLHRVVERARAGFVVTDRDDLRHRLAGLVPSESFDDFLGAACRGDGRLEDWPDPGVPHGATTEASVVYTSGTTGLPKGVILSHGNFLFVTAAVLEYLGLVPEDRYALVLPLSHSYGKSVLLTSLEAGAAVSMVTEFPDLPRFLSRLAGDRCSVLSAVPYHAHVFLRRGDLASVDLSALRALTFSGNRLPPQTLDALGRALPHVRIFPMYGLTESTTRACYLPPELASVRPASCGRPLAGTELRIVGEGGQDLPAARVGEVWLRGPNVMQGYLEEPELTREVLVDGWLRTGDLAYRDSEGFVFLAGRTKDIIKCAGERISPGEIEDALLAHPSVLEAAAVGHEDAVLGEAVWAYLVGREGFRDEGELRRHCAERLSAHKLPRRYVFLDRLPRTSSGKVQKVLLGEG